MNDFAMQEIVIHLIKIARVSLAKADSNLLLDPDLKLLELPTSF